MNKVFRILNIEKDSLGKRLGIKTGDVVLSFDGTAPLDILDYEFYDGSENFTLEILRKNTERKTISVNKCADQTLGLVFDEETYLKSAACNNKCVFCFVDQLPRGMRKTLYFKDDDWRLSFVSGNYVTLTNVNDAVVERICEKKFSPLYISVHATDDDVRRKILQNPKAVPILPLLKKFSGCGITMHAQIVLCPGINDGAVLNKSLEDMFSFYPQLASLAIVPVGLTKHRNGLSKVKAVDKQKALEIINTVEKFSAEAKLKTDNGFAYCSDEFYLKAGLPLPDYGFYGDFGQIENGVGLITKFEAEFNEALDLAVKCRSGSFSVVTGVSAFEFINRLVGLAKQKFPALNCNVLKIENEFFGESVTVSGLITSGDIINQVKGRELNNLILIPKTMLKEFDNVFLDGMSVKELSKVLKRKINVVGADGYEFCAALLKGVEL